MKNTKDQGKNILDHALFCICLEWKKLYCKIILNYVSI